MVLLSPHRIDFLLSVVAAYTFESDQDEFLSKNDLIFRKNDAHIFTEVPGTRDNSVKSR